MRFSDKHITSKSHFCLIFINSQLSSAMDKKRGHHSHDVFLCLLIISVLFFNKADCSGSFFCFNIYNIQT